MYQPNLPVIPMILLPMGQRKMFVILPVYAPLCLSVTWFLAKEYGTQLITELVLHEFTTILAPSPRFPPDTDKHKFGLYLGFKLVPSYNHFWDSEPLHELNATAPPTPGELIASIHIPSEVSIRRSDPGLSHS